MAKAQFHKGQRVFVRSVGTWSHIDKVIPHWVTGVEEPLKIFYEVGLGRQFQGHELMADRALAAHSADGFEHWRLLRMRSAWSLESENGDGVVRTSFPVVVTDAVDWGGWRVPKAEYDRDPERIEHQARVLVNALAMLRLLRELTNYAETTAPVDDELGGIVARAAEILQRVHLDDAAPARDIAAE